MASNNNYKDFEELVTWLNGIDQKLIDGAKKTIATESKKQAAAVRKDAPVRKEGISKGKGGKTYPHGYYAQKWGSRKEEETSKTIMYRVRNTGDQKSLAHLLEWDHRMPQGGRSGFFKHLVDNKRNTEETIQKELEKLADEIFK